MPVYAPLRAFLADLVPTWRRTHLTNLALLVAALLTRRSLSVSELARAYPGGFTHAMRKKRLWRFLENGRLDLAALRRRFTYLALHACRVPEGQRVPILIDTTYWEPYAVLVAAVPRAGRALPLHWRTYRRDLVGEPEPSQNQIEEVFCTQLLERVPLEWEAVLVADRGFGRADLIGWLQQRGAAFVLRVTADVHLRHPAYTGLARALPLRRGQRRWFTDVVYRQDGAVTVHLLAFWGRDHDEPWLLVTNLTDPKEVETLYRRRMRIEHSFRDWKHHLRCRLPLSRMVQSARRFGRLVTALILAAWFLCLVGLGALPRGYRQQVVSWGTMSVFRLALEFLTWPPPGAWARVDRLLDRLARALAPSRIDPSDWQLRYRRFRPKYCTRRPLPYRLRRQLQAG